MRSNRLMGLLALSAAICFGATLFWTSCKQSTPPPVDDLVTLAIASDGWKVPLDAPANPTLDDWLDFGWETFVALNWPAQSGGQPGQPDTTANILTTSGTAAWQSFIQVEQVFQPGGANPGTWLQPSLAFPTQVDPASGDTLIILGGLSKFSGQGKISDEFDEAESDRPLIDQSGNYVYYNIQINQSEFEYITANGFYGAQAQKDSVSQNTFPTFADGENSTTPAGLPAWADYGSTELKTSWKVLVDGTDDFSNYYTMKAYAANSDGSIMGPFTFGLVGMHILRLTPLTHSTWFWATFEQVDNLEGSNPSFTPSADSTWELGYSYQPDEIEEGTALPTDPTPVGVSRVTPIPQNVQTANTAWQTKLAGTVWENYQLINTLQPYDQGTCTVSPGGTKVNACGMVNATMETYTQGYKSGSTVTPLNCTSCHQTGYPQYDGTLSPADSSNLQIFTFLLGRAM